MILDLQARTVTFKRSTFDQTYRKGDVISYVPELVRGWDKRFVLAQIGPKSIVLYKVRKLKNDVMLFHAFTGTPSLLSRQRRFTLIGTLDKK